MSKTDSSKKAVLETTDVGAIANFYGFKPVEPPTVSKEDLLVTRSFTQEFFLDEKAALIRKYFEEKQMALPQPVMLFTERPFPNSKDSQNRRRPLFFYGSLVSLGSAKSVCECLFVEGALTMLQKLGYKHLKIHINSIGDKESASEFQKKIQFFIRKNYNDFPADLRQEIKKNPMAIFEKGGEDWRKWQDEAPKSIEFLSETSRCYFKEILEFLETIEVPYTIDHSLVGDPYVGSEVIFAIRDEKDSPEENLAYGFRINRLAKKMGHKKGLSVCFLDIMAKGKTKTKTVKIKNGAPKFFLVQFGEEARLKSFLALRELYKAKVDLGHAIAKDRLSVQMGMAEHSGAPYIILIGQKEALENSAIVRNVATRHQDLVPIAELSKHIKGLK